MSKIQIMDIINSNLFIDITNLKYGYHLFEVWIWIRSMDIHYSEDLWISLIRIMDIQNLNYKLS